jgi:hypothetical protein
VEPPEDEDRTPIHERRLGRSPQELFAEYLADRGATDERVMALFDQLLDAEAQAG